MDKSIDRLINDHGHDNDAAQLPCPKSQHHILINHVHTIPHTHRPRDCCLSPTRGCAEPPTLTLPPSSRLMARFEARCPRFLCFCTGGMDGWGRGAVGGISEQHDQGMILVLSVRSARPSHTIKHLPTLFFCLSLPDRW